MSWDRIKIRVKFLLLTVIIALAACFAQWTFEQWIRL